MNETAAPTPHPPGGSTPLSGRHAVVTGAGRGIGRAIAEALARSGAEVTAIARTAADLEEVAAQINLRGGRATAVTCDVLDEADLDLAFASITVPDILVNCAGTNRPGPFADVSTTDLDLLLALNVRSVFTVTQRAVRGMLDAGRTGVIINVTSQMGHVGAANRTVYCMTKHAVEGLTKALAVELAPHGIRAVSVAPTFVDTPLTRPFLDDPQFRADVVSAIPLGRLGTVEEVADVVVFAASPAASLITGTSLLADGGWTAR